MPGTTQVAHRRPLPPSWRREPAEFLACAEQQRRGVDNPIDARFLPDLPPIGKPLIYKHRLDVFKKQCRLALDLLGLGVVAQKCEEKPELSGGADQIILSQQFGKFLFQYSMVVIGVAFGIEN